MSEPVCPRLQQVIEIIESLSPAEQRQLVEIVRQRLIQYQRAELVREVAEARQAYQQGQVRRGTVADLMRELDQPTVIRTDRGWSIAGTRITLYDIMDYLTANWPPELVRDWFNLTGQQMADVMDYIETHRTEVEAEYSLFCKRPKFVATGRHAIKNALPKSLPYRPSQGRKKFEPSWLPGRRNWNRHDHCPGRPQRRRSSDDELRYTT